MESLIKTKSIEISLDHKNKYMYCNWIGYQNTESIMASGKIILEELKKNGIAKVLNDNTLVTGPWNEAAEWTANVWFPNMVDAGLRHFSWIFSKNIFTELSAKKAMPGNDIVKSFKDFDEARKWLISQ